MRYFGFALLKRGSILGRRSSSTLQVFASHAADSSPHAHLHPCEDNLYLLLVPYPIDASNNPTIEQDIPGPHHKRCDRVTQNLRYHPSC